MKINLRRLATTDLSTRFARSTGLDESGKQRIIHYRVPQADVIAYGKDPLTIVRDYISKTENLDLSEVGTGEDDESDLLPVFNFPDGKTLQVVKVPELLRKHKSIERSLSKLNSKQMIHESISYATKYDQYKSMAIYQLNRIIGMVNPILLKMAMKLTTNKKSYTTRAFIERIKDTTSQTRITNQIAFISVAFEWQDYDLAKQALVSDLKILQENGLIMGNISMPSLIAFADTIGISHRLALFCFPVIDSVRCEARLGIKSAFQSQHQNLKELGLKYVGQEGEVVYLNGANPADKYNIETITILQESEDQIRNKLVEAYNESLPKIAKISEACRKDLMEMKKLNNQKTILEKK